MKEEVPHAVKYFKASDHDELYCCCAWSPLPSKSALRYPSPIFMRIYHCYFLNFYKGHFQGKAQGPSKYFLSQWKSDRAWLC